MEDFRAAQKISDETRPLIVERGELRSRLEQIEIEIARILQEPRPSRKEGAAIVLFNADGDVLAVPRKTNPNDLGLPGGKREGDESFEECAIREASEETGLHVRIVKEVLDGFDITGFHMITYLVECDSFELSTTETAAPKWVHPSRLLEGSFGGYNLHVLREIYKDLESWTLAHAGEDLVAFDSAERDAIPGA